jgi:hypothetical protein
MAYGDAGGAIGYLVGEPNRGMECMFTMMNNARLGVGLQGVAIAERSYQQARDYARQRIQGRPVGVKGNGTLPIVHHGDVRRMLIDMRALTEAARALTYLAAATIDRARRHPDEAERQRQQRRADLLIPIVKAWCTDIGVEVASLGVQVHGGVGYIEETGAAQHLRDARITPIYEGTNGIQALDLVGRKLARDSGAAAHELILEMRRLAGEMAELPGDDMATIRAHFSAGLDALERATDGMASEVTAETPRAFAGAAPYLRLCGTVIGGWLLAKCAHAADRALRDGGAERGFLEAKLATARFYAEHRLALAPALLPAVNGGATVMSFDPEWF